MATSGGGKDDNDINIPNDVVAEILLCLPAKSLVRLQWTCKYWFELVTRDSDFAKMHIHHHSTTITTYASHDHDIFSIISPSVLSTNYAEDYRVKILQCYLNYNDTTRVADVFGEASIALPLYGSYIVGSSNGLILLRAPAVKDNLCIWNPCTKEYKVLPHPLTNEHLWREEGCNYGFGYDHTNDDYKVIRTAYSYGLYNDVQVYTLGTNSWRTIGPTPYGLYRLKDGVFVNGALYWMDYNDKNIFRFDFGTETFQHVSATPDSITTANLHSSLVIHVFEGSVCLVLMTSSFSEIWMMKDYVVNNNESLWTELSTISGSNQIWPLKYTRNGEILMLKNRDLVLHDQKSNSAQTLCWFCKKLCQVPEVVYIESLVYLKSGTYK